MNKLMKKVLTDKRARNIAVLSIIAADLANKVGEKAGKGVGNNPIINGTPWM